MSKFCRNCGAALHEDAAFCTNCGTPAEQPAQGANVPPATISTAQPQTTQPAASYAAPKPRSKKRLLWIIPVVLLLLAAVAAGGWFLFTPHADDYYQSKVVSMNIDISDGDRYNSVTEYREDGQIIRTSSNGSETVYEYNEDGKVATISGRTDDYDYSVPIEYTEKDGNYYGRAVMLVDNADSIYIELVYDRDLHLLSKEVGSLDGENVNTEVYEYYADGTMKRYVTTSNIFGDSSETVAQYDRNGDEISYMRYEEGLLIQSNEYADGTIQKVYRATTWNDTAVLEYAQEEYENGILCYSNTYDENDNLIETTSVESKKDGVITSVTYDAESKLVRKVISYLDAKNRLEKLERFDENNNLYSFVEWTYDDLGHTLSNNHFDGSGNLIASYTYTWLPKG